MSEDALCAWEAGGREALTFGTGPNGPVCLLIGLLQLSEGKAVEVLRQNTRLTAEAVRQTLKEWNGQDEKQLNLAQVRNRAEDLAHADGRRVITPEDFLVSLADEDSDGTRLLAVMKQVDPEVNLAALRLATTRAQAA